MPSYDDDEFDWASVFGGGGDGLEDVPIVPGVGDDFGDNGGSYDGRADGADTWDWKSYLGDPSSYLSKFLSGSKDTAGALAKIFGGGAGGMGGLLPLLLMGLGGYKGYEATKDASKQIQDAANKANDFAVTTLGGARNDFKPYMEGGTKALDMVFNQLNQPGIASKYLTPINRTGPSGLKGTVSLKQLINR